MVSRRPRLSLLGIAAFLLLQSLFALALPVEGGQLSETDWSGGNHGPLTNITVDTPGNITLDTQATRVDWNINIERSQLSAATINSSIYVVGGFDGNRLDHVEEYDPVLDQGLSTYQADIAAFMAKMSANAGKPEGRFGNADVKAFYARTSAQLQTFVDRAEALDDDGKCLPANYVGLGIKKVVDESAEFLRDTELPSDKVDDIAEDIADVIDSFGEDGEEVRASPGLVVTVTSGALRLRTDDSSAEVATGQVGFVGGGEVGVAGLWELRGQLIKMYTRREGYFLDIEEVDFNMYPTLLDYLVFAWTNYLLTEEVSEEPDEYVKPRAEILMVENFDREVSPADPPALLAAELMEEAA